MVLFLRAPCCGPASDAFQAGAVTDHGHAAALGTGVAGVAHLFGLLVLGLEIAG